ncbi:Saposin B-type domain-containing protein [Entamoeba marina]
MGLFVSFFILIVLTSASKCSDLVQLVYEYSQSNDFIERCNNKELPENICDFVQKHKEFPTELEGICEKFDDSFIGNSMSCRICKNVFNEVVEWMDSDDALEKKNELMQSLCDWIGNNEVNHYCKIAVDKLYFTIIHYFEENVPGSSFCVQLGACEE